MNCKAERGLKSSLHETINVIQIGMSGNKTFLLGLTWKFNMRWRSLLRTPLWLAVILILSNLIETCDVCVFQSRGTTHSTTAPGLHWRGPGTGCCRSLGRRSTWTSRQRRRGDGVTERRALSHHGTAAYFTRSVSQSKTTKKPYAGFKMKAWGQSPKKFHCSVQSRFSFVTDIRVFKKVSAKYKMGFEFTIPFDWACLGDRVE